MKEKRAPIVVVLGHVDHGKTTILDYIKKSNVAGGESGGITQHIGAYEIEYNDSKITFVDTPGHAAFTSMRSRGAKVADIAVLVVAADDGVKAQTKEAIEIIKEANIPFIVALNKIDKPEANAEKAKGDLAKNNILVESIGGDIPSVNTSAKEGKGINELLDLILLMAELNDLQADPEGETKGVIIESHLDKQSGAVATLLIKEGTLKVGDVIASQSSCGKIRAMQDFRGKKMDFVLPSQPCSVLGFSKVPAVGEEFVDFSCLADAKEYVKEECKKSTFVGSKDAKILNLIIKVDVNGMIEAIDKMIKEIPLEEVGIKIIKTEVGNITEDDIKSAQSCNARIIGFRTKADANIKRMADDKKIKLMFFDVIYELVQAVEIMAKSLIEPKIVREDQGKLKTLLVFLTDKKRQIVGGRVIEGYVEKGALIEVFRDGELIGKGKMVNLQKNKKPIERASKRDEIGILFEGNTRIEQDDEIVFYTLTKKKAF